MSLAEIIDEYSKAIKTDNSYSNRQEAKNTMIDKMVEELKEAEASASKIHGSLNSRLSCDIHRWIRDVESIRSL